MSRPHWDDASVSVFLDEVATDVLDDVGDRLAGIQRRLLSLHGTGRLYATGFFTDPQGRVHPVGRAAPHEASAPGQPPALDTGALRASVAHRVGHEGERVHVDVGAMASHVAWIGRLLEYGTRRMDPRPWLRPSLDALAAEDRFHPGRPL